MSPSARKVASLLTTARDHLSWSDAVVVVRIQDALPNLAAALVTTHRFIAMVRSGTADTLNEWLTEAEDNALAACEPIRPPLLPRPRGPGRTDRPRPRSTASRP